MLFIVQALVFLLQTALGASGVNLTLTAAGSAPSSDVAGYHGSRAERGGRSDHLARHRAVEEDVLDRLLVGCRQLIRAGEGGRAAPFRRGLLLWRHGDDTGDS